MRIEKIPPVRQCFFWSVSRDQEPCSLGQQYLDTTHDHILQEKQTSTCKQQLESHSFFLFFVAGDFFDSYGNTTLKQVLMMQWLQRHCFGVHFMLKIDDDVLLNLRVVQHAVTTSMLHRNVMGTSVSTPSVIQNTIETLVDEFMPLTFV